MSVSSTGGASLSFGGVISGIDWNSIVTQLMEIKRIPVTMLEQKKDVLNYTKIALQSANTKLLSFQETLEPFVEGIDNQRDVTNSNPDVLTATAESYAQEGTYVINVTQLATQHRVASDNITDLGVASSSTDLVAAGVLTAGQQFTINAETFTVGAAYSINDIISQVNTAMDTTAGNKVTASYINGRLVLEADETGTGNAITASDIGGGTALADLGILDPSSGSNLALGGAASVSSTSGGAAANLNDDDPLSIWQSLAAPNQWAEIDLGAEMLVNQVVVKHNAITESFVIQVQQGEDWVTVDTRAANSSDTTTHDFTQVTTQKIRVFDADPSDTVGGKLDLSEIKVYNQSTSGSFAHELTAAQNAAYTINGDPVDEPTSWSNENTDSINGVTLELNSTGTTTISIGPDVENIVAQVKAFVEKYNDSETFMYGKLSEKRVADAQTTEDLSKGLLTADFDLMWISGEMRTRSMDVYNDPAHPEYNLLSSIGVSSTPYTGGGTASVELEFDEAKLRSALADDFEGVSSLLKSMATDLNTAMESVTEVSVIESDAGAIPRRMMTIDKEITGIDEDIANWEDRLEQEEARLRAQYAALENKLAELQSQSTYLSAAIQSLTASSSSNSSSSSSNNS